MSTAKAKTYTLRALTDIWTGDADGKPDRVITTGLLGSIRWWFEVLVRGLEGCACDPTSPVRCPDSGIKDPTKPGHHCVVCELFGCTGWARKFRFEVLKLENGQEETQISQIANGDTFLLRFTELRPAKPEEWILLDATLRLIADYGAIGGKTVYKPTDEKGRESAPHHRDYGLIEYVSEPPDWSSKKTRDELTTYVLAPQWRRCPHQYRDDQNRIRDFSWASLANFWCVKGRYLARQDQDASTFNRVIGRPEPKSQTQNGDSWLAGKRARPGVEPESKKVFSFKEPVDARRTFGFVESPRELNEVGTNLQQRLSGDWPGFDAGFVRKGSDILGELLGSEEAKDGR
jgi:CRISPR-associated protein Cmr1